MTQETQENKTSAVSGTATAAAPPASAPPAPRTPKAAAQKRKAKKRIKRIIALIVVLALLAGGGWALWYFVFRDTVEQGELLTDVARIDTIQSKVEGSGNAVAKDMAAVTVSASGTVQEVYVNQGDMVYQGQMLYSVVSPAAQEAITAAEKAVQAAEEEVINAQEAIGEVQEGVTEANERVTEARSALAERQKELAELQSAAAGLSVTAPFAGKLISVENIAVGSTLPAGSVVASLANDRVMRLSLYFSYAYENSIYIGQSAQVSIPDMAFTCQGTVSDIHKISLVSSEGAILFEVVIDLPNPGTLTAGVSASATMTDTDGSPIYPYDQGELSYAEIVELKTALTGPVTSKALFQYTDVTAGQVLLVQGADDLNTQIADKQREVTQAEKDVEQAVKGVTSAEKAVDQARQRVTVAEQGVVDAQAKVAEAQKALEDLNAVSPIDGTIVSSTITPGMEVKGGDTVMTISNTAQMSVEISVDDRNIGFVQPGMMVELSDWSGNTWMGAVTNITMIPDQSGMGSGVTNYPVTLTVDNYDGSLLSGMWLQYSFVASQSDNCLIVPIQAVKSTTDEEGNEIYVVFIQAESRPDNAVTMPEQSPDMPKRYPAEEDGFYAVPVTTGLNDTYNVEIKSGLNEGDTVFTNYLSASGDSWGMMYG